MAIAGGSGTWVIGSNWPWPRMFITDYYVLAFAIDGDNLSLYELINSANVWTATKVCVLHAHAEVDSVSVAAYEKYYIVSVFGYVSDVLWVRMIERDPLADPGLSAVSDISSGTIPHGTALCNYKGQLLVGGLKSSDAKWSGLGTCAVAHSGIGNIVFNPATDPSAGFLKMSWDTVSRGKIYALKVLRNAIIVYGDRGIERLVPFDNAVITGFGQKTIWAAGILGFNCVCGTYGTHCFIDTNYDLCLIQNKIRVVGYRRFMKLLNRDKIIISYEPSDRHFYISDGLLCYVLTEHGLYSTNQCMTSIGKYNDIVCGFIKDNSDDEIRLTTTETDFGYQTIKSVEDLEYGINYATVGEEELFGRVSVRYSYSDSFIDLPWIVLNKLGIFTQKTSGRTFKFSVKSNYESGAEFSIDSLVGKIKFVDKRYVRGRLNVR